MRKNGLKYAPWLLVCALYSRIIYQLYNLRWQAIDYTHAYFILPISLWLVWRMRPTLRQMEIRSSPISATGYLILLSLGLFAYFFGWQNDYLLITSGSLILVLLGMSGFLFGTPILQKLLFPILYLVFFLPPPLGILDAITIPMRFGTAEATTFVLQLLHYPIEKTGLMLTMGGHEILVGKPCSGFRSLITMISLGTLYVYFTKGTAFKKAFLVACVIPLALLGNVLRVTGICLITYYWGEKAAQGFLHEFSGILVFLFCIVGLISIEKLLKHKGRDQ